jgi:hypothetical protein
LNAERCFKRQSADTAKGRRPSETDGAVPLDFALLALLALAEPLPLPGQSAK